MSTTTTTMEKHDIRFHAKWKQAQTQATKHAQSTSTTPSPPLLSYTTHREAQATNEQRKRKGEKNTPHLETTMAVDQDL
jgi:hypothetical protein